MEDETSEVYHLEVVTGHELDVHRLPLSSRVCVPPNLAGAPLIIDMSRIRNCGVNYSQDDRCQGQNDSSEIENATRKHWNKKKLVPRGREKIGRWVKPKKKKIVEG